MGLVCWAHISSAIQHALAETTDSLAQPLLRYCFKVFCNVQSGECIFTCELYSQDVRVLSVQNTRAGNNGKCSVLKLVGKTHKVQPQNLYKFGSHSSRKQFDWRQAKLKKIPFQAQHIRLVFDGENVRPMRMIVGKRHEIA
jgi:hypothetical protein